jgi:hypothetical protein
MSNFREKAQVFIIGLSIGLLIAGAFFILKLDDYFKELNLYKKVSQTFTEPPKPSENNEKKEEGKTKKKENNRSTKAAVATTPDSVTNSEEGTSRTLNTDTLANKSDSLNAAMVAEGDVVVRKDELISTKTLEVYNLDPTAKATGKDSLLQKVSGIKDDKSSGKQMFNIELWSSPLNYKGYKMSRYKMVLYGITTTDGIKLYKLDDVIYMKNGSNVYRLDHSADFKPYERITDELILTKLK